MNPRLPARLRAVLELVPPQARSVADVGAGHGALSAHLAATRDSVIAVESQRGPFAELCANLRRWEVQQRVDARIGDGLRCLAAGEADAAVVAGLGAQRTLNIVSEAGARGVRWLVLQCMQRPELVEPWLRQQHWPVLERRDVRDGRHRYPTWLVEVAA